ncbi:MAG: metallophosphoesterase, partial [Nitrosomonadaceae bacterium]
MRATFPAFAGIFILATIWLVPPSFSQAILYSDNFDDGDISEYDQFGSTWSVVPEPGRGDVLRHSSNGNTVIFPTSQSFSTSYQVIAEVWNEDDDAVGVAFRINPLDPDNLYSCATSGDSAYSSGIWHHVNDVDGTPTTPIATQPWVYERSRWYTVTITIDVASNTINCTWESQEAGIEFDITATDPNPAATGSVGIWLSHQDNFKGDLLEVRSLGPPDNMPPEITVTKPQNMDNYAFSEVPLEYTASDDVGLSGCSYELDGITTQLPNCLNSILSSLTLQPHTIKVIATDTSNNVAESPLIQFSVSADNSPPEWNPTPVDFVLLQGQPLFYDADATDNVAVDSFFIDDTTNFQIDSITGILENKTSLAIGTYNLLLSVNDTSNNINSEPITISVQEVGVTPPGFKVAFIADQGSGGSATAVLNVILNEGADMVMHQGDFDYNDNPDAWDAKITSVLGPDFPYFASVGNHDDGSAVWSAYQQKLTDRLALIDGAVCTFGSGGIGVKQSCTYNGLFFVLSGVGTLESNHATYIQNEMANDNSIWRICSWHKNMNAMQLGTKGDSTGWEVYEECRMAGAIVATGHEHTYSRTRTLSSVQNQIVDPAWPDTNNVRVGEGSTFVFVAGLGGAGMRNQDRCESFTFPYGCNDEWASIYTTDQNSKHGALFCSFNVGGQANKAHCYFKDIEGNIPDQFDVTSFNSVPAGSPPVLAPIGGQIIDEGALLAFTATATDSDIPPDTLTFSLSGEPASASITSGGDFTWTPTEAQGPNTYMFDVIVSDGLLTDSETITVTVDAVNAAPILAPIGSKIIDEGVLFAFTATATDSD